MKKQAYVIIALTSFLFVFFFSHSLLEILDLTGLSFCTMSKKQKNLSFYCWFSACP